MCHSISRGGAVPQTACRYRSMWVPGSTPALEHDGSRHIIAAVLRERTQRFGTGTRLARARKNPRAANGGPIHVRLALGNSAVPGLRIFPAQGRIDRQSRHDAHPTGVFASLDVGQASSLPAPILPAGFADLVNERLIGLDRAQFPLPTRRLWTGRTGRKTTTAPAAA